MPSAMVTFNGRITIPTQVRKQLGLKTGDNVDFVEIENGRFAIISGHGSIEHSAERAPLSNQERLVREMNHAAV